jgi:cell division protein FtsQ
VAVTAGWLVGFSSVLAAHRVQVTGTKVLSQDQVRTAAQVPLGTPLARQDVGAIADRVAALSLVSTVTVSRQWPTTVVVAVQERTPVLAIRQPAGLLLVDRTGVGYQTVAAVPDGVLVADVDPANPALLTEVGVVASALPAKLRSRVDRVEALGPDAIRLVLKDSDVVVWGSSSESVLKAEVLLALLKQKGSTYDVSAPHTPAYR